ncbi:rhodanese-like domain-containing protein [Pelomonas sp. SE-A7]|uniref:rhodanese-like domain-containing protein n=1 Tax=Pelomonas sp. SE-A7 TaxID=3054953 RepID=UPI00259CCE87|nr:rhodanese-like domain-containing protein [Pelomonas sp. SE-A7]MDM4767928.1 rhodanese-like domain-containing protein [Pelomonas sp. SE-A7]
MLWNSTLLPAEGFQAPPELPMHDHEAAPAGLPPEALLLDVRSYSEFMSGHVEGARCLPLPRLMEDIVHLVPDPSLPIVLYCSSGTRAEQALRQLRRMGYLHVSNGGTPQHLAGRLGRAVQRGM